MKKSVALALTAAAAASIGLTACSSEADTVSQNLSTDADNYKINRQIVFYNGITGQYVAEVTGLCSIGNNDAPGQVTYTCKVGPDTYIKNFLHISDNVTWFALQTQPATSDPYHYEIVLKPEEIIPNVQFNTSGNNIAGTPATGGN